MAISDRGFASMDKAKQRAIAVKGGRHAHAIGVAHEWDSAEASEAGKKGGRASAAARLARKLKQSPAA